MSIKSFFPSSPKAYIGIAVIAVAANIIVFKAFPKLVAAVAARVPQLQK